jgi:trehalose synthase
VFEVNVAARSVEPFSALVPATRMAALERTAAATRALFGTRAVWNINSTAAGGGVAEMLRSILRYSRGLGVHIRWLVVEGPPEFFRITKRIHNALHGTAGDGSPLGPEEANIYEQVLHQEAIALDAYVREDDIVILHDPQTAGLVPHLVARGVRVVWRCHIGHEHMGVELDRGWTFLRKYIEPAPLCVFSRGVYAPPWLPRKRTVVLAPTIDPFSAKNLPMNDAAARVLLSDVGIVDGERSPTPPIFVRDDGSIGRVDHKAEVIRLGRAPSWDTPLVVQVSRWDHMKDPRGVLQGFACHVASSARRHAELVLAGPQMRSIADDPEGPQVFHEVELAWRALPESLRRTVHLAQLPMDDFEENAAIVNALQRHAAVIVQKSLVEGFGLTVTEAMWKTRPVVATAVGGIQDQIKDGYDGLILKDPTDLREFGALLRRVLEDDVLARRLGEAAHRRVLDWSLSITSLESWAALLRSLLELPLQAPPGRPYTSTSLA